MVARLEGNGEDDHTVRDGTGDLHLDSRVLENRQEQFLAAQRRQRGQMLLALGLLAIALIVVLVKDRQFWFPSSSTGEEAAQQNEAQPDEAATGSSEAPSQTPAETTSPAATTQPTVTKPKHHVARAAAHDAHPAPSQEQISPSIVATNRAALPPLEVEVVAGGQKQTVQPSGPSVHVDMQSGTPPIAPGARASTMASSAPAKTQPAAATSNESGGERVSMSPATSEVVERPVEPSYPVLAKQMKVQGSVILQALIGREGSIQDLRVLSGPAILSTAAMDAVRQWHFRPYYQSGQAIETEARITVNFTISTY